MYCLPLLEALKCCFHLFSVVLIVCPTYCLPVIRFVIKYTCIIVPPRKGEKEGVRAPPHSSPKPLSSRILLLSLEYHKIQCIVNYTMPLFPPPVGLMLECASAIPVSSILCNSNHDPTALVLTSINARLPLTLIDLT